MGDAFKSRWEDFQDVSPFFNRDSTMIYQAKNKIDGCKYAIKRVNPHKTDFKSSLREARALASLSHPHIIKYFTTWIETNDRKIVDELLQELENAEKQTKTASCQQTKTREKPVEYKLRSANDGLRGENAVSRETSEISSPDALLDDLCMDTSDEENENSDDDEELLDNELCEQTDVTSTTDTTSSQYTTGFQDLEIFIFIQMELCLPNDSDHLDLARWLQENNQIERRDHIKIWRWFRQLIKAVTYMHKKNLIHRDIKPANIFFSSKRLLKIGDLGSSRPSGSKAETQLENQNIGQSDLTDHVGTQFYMSPEQRSCKVYNQKIDVYALGVVFLELIFPFENAAERREILSKLPENFPDMAQLQTKKPEAKKLSKSMFSSPGFSFVKWMCNEDSKSRPNSWEIEKIRWNFGKKEFYHSKSQPIPFLDSTQSDQTTSNEKDLPQVQVKGAGSKITELGKNYRTPKK